MRRFPSSLLQFTSRDRLPSYFALGMLIGAIWYFSIDSEPSFASLFLFALGAAAALCGLAKWARSTVFFVGSVMVFAAALGALSGAAATQRLSHAQIETPMGQVLVEGWITSVQPAKRGVRVVLTVHAVDRLPAEQTPAKVRLTHISRFETEPGRFVRCWAVLRPPPAPVIDGDYAFHRQAWYNGLGAVGYVQGRCRGGTLGQPAGWMRAVQLRIGEVRRQLAQHVRAGAGERAGGLAAALASGDRSFLSQDDQDALRSAGLAHLLAISGLHIGIVGGLIFLIVWRGLALIEPIALRWSVKKPAAAAAILICGLYLVISGASVSTQRAFVMAVIFFGAVLMDREALTQRSLAIAMIAIIILAPWSVLTPGFQMSFAATLVLIATYESWRTRRQKTGSAARGVGFWMKSLLVTSTVTSLATMPFALHHFDRIAGLGVLANVLAMPIISLVSAPLSACALILAPIGLDGPALRGFGLSLEWVLQIAHVFDQGTLIDGLRLPQMPAFSLALFSSAIITCCVSTAGLSRALIVAALTMTAVFAWSMSARDRIHWAPSGDIYFEHAGGGVERIALLKGEGLRPLRYSDVTADASCPANETCLLGFKDRQVLFVPRAAPSVCVQIFYADIVFLEAREMLQTDCAEAENRILIKWSDVVAENGVTLEKRSGSFRKRRKPACDSRPWRRCR